jgi:hypothetical protein
MIKNFDCVESKHISAAKIYKSISKMGLKDELDYWRKKTDIMKQQKSEFRNIFGKNKRTRKLV